MLIKADADVNAKNNIGTTALIRAFVNDYKKVINLLKRYGAK